MTPAPTVERSAVGQSPDPRQRLLIELVRNRNAAATSRLLEAWVHRRGLASLEAFCGAAVPELFSEADALWLESCLHEPLERRLMKAEVAAVAQAPAPQSLVPQAAILEPVDLQFEALLPAAGESAVGETAVGETAAVSTAAVEAAAFETGLWQPLTTIGFVPQPAADNGDEAASSCAGDDWPRTTPTSQPATSTQDSDTPTPGPSPDPLTDLGSELAGPWPDAAGRATPPADDGWTSAEAPFARRQDGPADRALPGPGWLVPGPEGRDQELEPAGLAPWLMSDAEAERPAAEASLSSLASPGATAAPATPGDLSSVLSAQPQTDLTPSASGRLAGLTHGLEPGFTAAGAVLADAPQRLRRKLFGSFGKARVLMRACFEEAISTLHPHAEAQPDLDLERQSAVQSEVGLLPAAPAFRTAAAGSPASPSGASPSPAPPSAWHDPAPEPDPIDTAPAAAWTRSLTGSLPVAASLDRPLPGPPAPTPAALADLRAWLPGSSSSHERRAS